MVEIITIGDELLIGQIVDTNSAWMASELNKVGFPISQIISVHDNEEQILLSLSNALAKNKIVLVTGGLGPTKDDITKSAFCHFFKTELVFNDEVYQNIEQLFKHRPAVMNKLTKSQALVPKNCTVISNRVGTAPVMWFEVEGKVVVSMPGVPFEMKIVMAEEIIPRLVARFQQQNIINKTVQVYGYTESGVALKIADWENNLPKHIHLASLPNAGIIRLRLSSVVADGNRQLLEQEITSQFEKLYAILGDSIIANDDLPLEYSVFDVLRKKKLTLATAESCTGGKIAHKITSIAGSSEVFKGSVVAYANEVKRAVLNVSEDNLMTCGAVSREVVEQMAVGVRKVIGSDVAVAISGVAGPAGGSEDKPVGTVWIAVASDDILKSELFHFGKFPRNVVIERASIAALAMILEMKANL